MLEIDHQLAIPEDELQFSYVRSSGPGGQNVNKVNTKAVLRWNVAETESLPEAVRQRFLQQFRTRITESGELVMSSQRYRDQSRNAEDCRQKLKEMVTAVLTPPKPRKKTKPSRRAKARRLQEKKELSEKKQRRKPPTRD